MIIRYNCGPLSCLLAFNTFFLIMCQPEAKTSSTKHRATNVPSPIHCWDQNLRVSEEPGVVCVWVGGAGAAAEDRLKPQNVHRAIKTSVLFFLSSRWRFCAVWLLGPRRRGDKSACVLCPALHCPGCGLQLQSCFMGGQWPVWSWAAGAGPWGWGEEGLQ